MLSGTHRHPKQQEVVYGRPAAEVVSAAANALSAERLLVVTSRSLGVPGGLAQRIAAELGDRVAGVFAEVRAHSPREDVVEGAARARDLGCDLLVAVGGGSVIDATKAMQLCLAADVRTPEALSAFRAGAPDGARAAAALELRVRMVAVPTTLSAAEFTPFAGVTDSSRHAKEGYTHPLLAPRRVALDPRATLDTPPRLWFSTGLKAVDHAVEQLCNPERAPFADALAEAGLRALAGGLRSSKQLPEDLEARLECQTGMWLAISGASMGHDMGASHAIGHILGGLLGVPHGLTSAVMLPAVLEWNEAALGDRAPLVSTLLGHPELAPSEAIRLLCTELDLPTTLQDIGVDPARFREIAEHTMHDRGIRTNPRPIRAAEDVEEILALATKR
jgi:maleylacetate reductase